MKEASKIVVNAQMTRAMSGRAKSMRDIQNQYSRIRNRLYYDDYLSYGMDARKGEYPGGVEAEFNRRMGRLNDIYDRYEDNIAKAQGSPITGRGAAGYPGNMDVNRKMKRNQYAK